MPWLRMISVEVSKYEALMPALSLLIGMDSEEVHVLKNLRLEEMYDTIVSPDMLTHFTF